MNKSQAIHNFWSSFGLFAYDTYSVPAEAAFPYITYELSLDSFDNEVYLSASIWDYSTSWENISKKTDEISKSLGGGGKMLAFDEGAVWIKKGSPFAQRMGDEVNDNIKRMLINISAEFISE